MNCLNFFRSAFLVLVSLGSAWSAPLFGKLTIELQPNVTIRNITVHLSDISEIHSDGKLNPTELARLKEMVIETFPNLDTTKAIPAFRIKRLLEKAGYKDVEIAGLQSKVLVESRIVTLRELEVAIDQWVKDTFPAQYNIKLKYERLPHDWKIPVDEAIAFDVVGPSGQFGGNLVLTIKAMQEAQIASVAQARVHVEVFQEAVVVVRRIEKGEVLARNDLAVQQVDISKGHAGVVEQIDLAIGQSAKRDLLPNEVLYKSQLEPPILIQKGSVNRIEVINGQITMTLPSVRALQNGRQGEVIPFENPMNETNKLYARVVERGYAVVEIS